MRAAKPKNNVLESATANFGCPNALQSLLAAIVQSSDDAIFSRKLDGTVSSWNAAAERIFGYRAEEIIGRPSSILLPGDRPSETVKFLKRVQRGLSVEHIETVRVRKDGAALTVSLTVSPIRDAQGHIIGASTIARDITLQRRLEAELIEIGEQERKRVGHDLHDGLGQQVGGIELLCRGLARSLAKRRAPEAQTAALLVDQIRAALAQTRALSRGLAPVMDHPDALMLALENLASTTRSIYKIRCSFQCEEPILLADYGAAMHLFRIAQEAVTNAIRHGRTRFINIGLSRQKSRLILEIRDHGRGFPTHGQSGTGMGFTS